MFAGEIMYKSALILGLALGLTSASFASVIFSDNFSGNANANLASQNFVSGATTGFNFWAIGTSGNMDAGYFSVVSQANQIHSAFHGALDADNNATGAYAVYNAFFSSDAIAYSITLTGLTVGQEYSFGSALIPLAPNPPYPDVSVLRYQLDGVGLGADYTLNPAPMGSEAWINQSRNFFATSTTHTLSIKSVGGVSGAGNDFGVDNVRVEAVPEPMTIAGLSVGLAAFLRRRKRA